MKYLAFLSSFVNFYYFFFFLSLLCYFISKFILFLFYFLFFWQNFITILIILLKLYLIKFDNQIFQSDEHYKKYIKFFNNCWYNFFYSIGKYYIKLDIKKKRKLIIFLRWVLFITPFYWIFLFSAFYSYFCFLNTKFLIRLIAININFLIIKIFFSCIHSMYLCCNPSIYFFYTCIVNRASSIIKLFLKRKFWKITIFLEFILKKIIFYSQVYLRRLNRFIKLKRYYYYFYFFFRWFKWAFSYNKIWFFLNWVYKYIRILKNTFLIVLCFQFLNLKLFFLKITYNHIRYGPFV